MHVFVIHVKGVDHRLKHMQQELVKANLSAEFILEGDKHELNSGILANYFTGKMAVVSNASSCAYKHIKAYEEIVRMELPEAIIFEDDIYLDKHFSEKLQQCKSEIKTRQLENYIISLEETSLRYVKGSKREKGTLLYPNSRGRMAGAYLVDYKAASNMLADLAQNKTDQAIDWYHNHCINKHIINMFWIHPTIAIQGSISGRLDSTISNRRTNYFRISSFYLQRWYKKILWGLR